MEKIEVKDLTKIFGKHPQQAVNLLDQGKSKDQILKETGMTVGVNKASFDIKDGEIFVIMGLSGSGKSTLVRMLNRLIDPTSGTVKIDGDDVTKLNMKQLREVRRKKMSMVFQRFALFPHRSVLENVEYGLEVQNVDKGKRKKIAQESLELVGLKGYEKSMPSELSGGMQQRVGLARALANDADILLMDEAFSALDPLIRKDMQDELLSLQKKMKKTIVFITHDLDEALRIGDRIALMKDGAVVQIGTPEEILMEPANDYVEQFVEDVDVTKVFTAEHVMGRPEVIRADRGPRTALKIMKDAGFSTVYVVDSDKKLLGIVYADDAVKARDEEKELKDVLKPVKSVTGDTLLTDMFDKMSGTDVPLAVVDENGVLRGIVKRSVVISALANNRDVSGGNGVTEE